MHEDGLAIGRPLFAQAGLWFAVVEIAIHKIGDYFDGAFDVELFESLIQKVLGDGGDAVALFDGEFCDGQIAAVTADESDVCAMESGDERETTRSGHGTRQESADGVGNGVVDVEEVEGFGLEDFEHFCGKSESVGRMIKKRVARDFDLVKMDTGVVGIHPDGRGVADEMDVVSAGGKLLAELGGDDAGAAVRWVTGDADLHERGAPWSSVVSRGQIGQHSTGKTRHCL